MKLRPHSSRFIISNVLYNEEIVQYSAKLQELLYLLLEEKELDDNIRINLENSLSELTSSLPALKPDDYRYNNVSEPQTKTQITTKLAYTTPFSTDFSNNYLSKILIDNFDSLLKFSTSYFNLSLASHITKYVVELIYLLNYWEVVHLVYLNSNIINFAVVRF